MRGTGSLHAPRPDVAPDRSSRRPGEEHTGPDAGVGANPRLHAIARLEMLDGLRSRRQLVLRMITPLVLFAIVAAVTFLTRSAPGTRVDPYVVAVQGDLDGGRRTLDQLSPDRLRFVKSDDATLDAARIADVGMLVPDGLDERVARGQPASVVLFETALAAESRSAAAHVRAGFGQLHQNAVVEATRERQTQGTATLITLDVVNVERSTQSTQLQAAGLVTAIALLQAAMLVSTTATRLQSRHNRGLLAAQLLLPFERWRLALGKGLAELTLGIATAVPVLVLTMGVAAWTTQSRDGLAAALIAMVALLACFLSLALVMAAIGLLVGTISRTQEQVSLASAAVVVLAAIIASRAALAGLPPTLTATRFVPILGIVQSTRGFLLGAPADLAWMLVGVASTLSLAALLVRWAGRAFDAERLVLRGSA
ncbi:MAG: ABC transporter permease subunit [Actinobacteria bacterium]|nr:ABC transporter permease subunit [Actinomycetota bacterium]